MTCDRASRSLFEPPRWKAIAHLTKERLRGRLGSTQGVETNALTVQEDFTRHEAVTPVGIDPQRMAQERHGAVLRCAADEDHATLQRRVQIQLPSDRKRHPSRNPLVTHSRALPARRHIANRARTEVGERLVIKAPPDLLLPAPIKILDAVLESGFAWRCED